MKTISLLHFRKLVNILFLLFTFLFPGFLSAQCPDDKPEWEYKYFSIKDQLSNLKDFFEDFGYCKQTKGNESLQDIILTIQKKSSLQEKIMVSFDIEFLTEYGEPFEMHAEGIVFERDEFIKKGFGKNQHTDLQGTASKCGECKSADVMNPKIEAISITFMSGPQKDKTINGALGENPARTVPVDISSVKKNSDVVAVSQETKPVKEAVKNSDQPVQKTEINKGEEKIQDSNNSPEFGKSEQQTAQKGNNGSNAIIASNKSQQVKEPVMNAKPNNSDKDNVNEKKAKEKEDRIKEKQFKEQKEKEEKELKEKKKTEEKELKERQANDAREKKIKEREEKDQLAKEKEKKSKDKTQAPSTSESKKETSKNETPVPVASSESGKINEVEVQKSSPENKQIEEPGLKDSLQTASTFTSEKLSSENETKRTTDLVKPLFSPEEYNEKVKRKTEQFQEYLQQITDKTLSNLMVSSVINDAVKMFINEDAIVAVSSINSSIVKKDKIRDYLNKLSRLNYQKIELQFSEIYIVENFRLGPDNNYYGTVSFKQTFSGYSDNVKVYGDIQHKHMEVILKQYAKIEGNELKHYTDILFGSIHVIGQPEKH
jgi:hypothetical protein